MDKLLKAMIAILLMTLLNFGKSEFTAKVDGYFPEQELIDRRGNPTVSIPLAGGEFDKVYYYKGKLDDGITMMYLIDEGIVVGMGSIRKDLSELTLPGQHAIKEKKHASRSSGAMAHPYLYYSRSQSAWLAGFDSGQGFYLLVKSRGINRVPHIVLSGDTIWKVNGVRVEPFDTSAQTGIGTVVDGKIRLVDKPSLNLLKIRNALKETELFEENDLLEKVLRSLKETGPIKDKAKKKQ
ncbi:MAG: hypothetical protein ACFE0O_03955 [Opitutales bacterium]